MGPCHHIVGRRGTSRTPCHAPTSCWVLAGRWWGGSVRQLVLVRIIESASKLDSLRVPDEAGLSPP